MPTWEVIHKDHAGAGFFGAAPENLTFTLQKGELGPGSLNYEISFADVAVSFNKLVPYEVDFELHSDDLILMEGMLTATEIEVGSGFVSLGCRDWLHYLELRQFPFDPQLPNNHLVGTPPRGSAYEVTSTHINTILAVLLDNTLAMANSMPLAYTIPAMTATSDFTISLGDTESIYNKIQTLAQQSPGIFDFWTSPDRELHFAIPRRYDLNVINDRTLASHIFTDAQSGISSLKVTNTGPEMNHIFGEGSAEPFAADDTVNVGLAIDDMDLQGIYYRIDGNRSYGDVKTRNRVNALTRGDFSVAKLPRFDAELTVVVEAIENFWTIIYPGCAIWIDVDTGVNLVDSAWEVVAIEVTVTNENSATANLKLNKIYPITTETEEIATLTSPSQINTRGLTITENVYVVGG